MYDNICNFNQCNTAKRNCWTWYLFVNLPEGVVGLVSFWRGRSVTCQWWILEFGFVLQIFIFRLQIVEFGIVLQIYILSVALPIIFLWSSYFTCRRWVCWTKFTWSCSCGLFVCWDFLWNQKIAPLISTFTLAFFTENVNCLSVDTFLKIRK